MSRALWFTGAIVALIGVAHAQQPQALHDKEWYASHDAVRAATLKACYSDESYAHLYDCRNAADGENLVRARSLAKESNYLLDPNWWRKNPIARGGAAKTCTRGSGPAYEQVAPYCSLVFAVEIESRN